MSFLRIITCCLSLVSFSSLIYGQFLIYKRWPNDQIPYEIDDSLTHCEVGEAFTEFSKKTGVRFSPKTNERDFIYLFRSDSCYSSPILSLRNLTTESNGSSNEIIINWGAILSGMESKFEKISSKDEFIFGPYNFNSVMYAATTVFGKTVHSRRKPSKFNDLLAFLLRLIFRIF